MLDETFRAYELIVVDDGSTDGTPERISAFSGDIVSVRQKNQGVAGARNSGIRYAHGTLLAFLDGDDVWEAEKLEHQVATATRHPRSGLIVVDGVRFSGNTILRESLFPPQVADLLRGRHSATLPFYERMLRGNVISTTSQVLIPRAVLDDIGVSDMRFPICSDWDLYIRIAASYDVTFLDRHLVRWRYLETSASGPEELRVLRWALDSIAILKKHLRLAPRQYQSLIRSLLREKTSETAAATYWYGRQYDTPWARRHLLALVRRNPVSMVLAGYLLALYLPRPLVRRVGRALRPAITGRSGTRERNT